MMFAIHGRLVTIADQEFHLPPAIVTKMHANIGFDLLISFPPILGSLFAWLNGCSTRNAALVHTYLVKRERKKEEERLQRMNINTGAENLTGAHSFESGTGSPTAGGPVQQKPQQAPMKQPQRTQVAQQRSTVNQVPHQIQQPPRMNQRPTNQVPLQKPVRKPPPAYQPQPPTNQIEHHY